MKIAKSEVVKFIDNTIDRLKQAHEAEEDKKERALAKRLNEWQTNIAPQWAVAVKQIQTALRKNQPVTLAMLPVTAERYSKDRINYFEYPEFKRAEFKVPSDLSSTKALLSVVADDLVDVKSLSIASVRDIFRKYAA